MRKYIYIFIKCVFQRINTPQTYIVTEPRLPYLQCWTVKCWGQLGSPLTAGTPEILFPFHG